MEETIIFEDCVNGVYLKVIPVNPDAETSCLVYQNENKSEKIGQLLLEDIKICMDSEPCNRVKITINIEPIKD